MKIQKNILTINKLNRYITSHFVIRIQNKKKLFRVLVIVVVVLETGLDAVLESLELVY